MGRRGGRDEKSHLREEEKGGRGGKWCGEEGGDSMRLQLLPAEVARGGNGGGLREVSVRSEGSETPSILATFVVIKQQ